jgi:hypothetical protein
MNNDPVWALARALYDAENRCGSPWANLPQAELSAWHEKATPIVDALDRIGWELRFIPPET